MDFGIAGRKAIVCAASKGLGRACAISLAREGVELVITARTAETLEQTAAEIRSSTGAKVTAVAGVVDQDVGLGACDQRRRLATSATGAATTGSRRWTPTC
jgi:3-oxoacyl-[acyl-carrier protein] reductase